MLQDQRPLAERMRPHQINDLLGQPHLLGPGAPLRSAIESGAIPSMVLWGPPGVGKTTIANIIANQAKRPFYTLSAVSSGVKDVRDVISRAGKQQRVILFIDEIHRFNKSQQDALLGAVEKGVITLIGATTENPSFEVNSALLSRCQVYQETEFENFTIDLQETQALLRLSGGDARRLLNLLELLIDPEENTITITDEKVIEAAQRRVVLYDKGGEQHYDIISAFIKSVRGSDPNAAIYWLARMIEGGEDVKFIARRLVILASEDIGNANPTEDIGNANPTALVMATNCFQAVNLIGYPEAEIILSQCTAYLACSPKSNASYKAIKSAKMLVREKGDLQVPMSIRNAPTKLMKDEGYAKGYRYPHDYQGNFIPHEFLPNGLEGTKLYDPGNNTRENEIRRRLKALWDQKYDY
jgi:putative ATPase